MKSENYKNRLVKGLWSLTGLKSSEYIQMVKKHFPDTTGSRLRGVMSSTVNKNYRTANDEDILQSLYVVNVWATGEELKYKLESVDLIKLLECIDVAKERCSDDDRQTRRKELFISALGEAKN